MDHLDVVQRQIDAANAHDLEHFLGCYAEDVIVRNGDGRILLSGRDALREFHRPGFADPQLRVTVVNRLQVGTWVVDEEQTGWSGGSVHALVAYEIRDQLIQTMVALGGPS